MRNIYSLSLFVLALLLGCRTPVVCHCIKTFGGIDTIVDPRRDCADQYISKRGGDPSISCWDPVAERRIVLEESDDGGCLCLTWQVGVDGGAGPLRCVGDNEQYSSDRCVAPGWGAAPDLSQLYGTEPLPDGGQIYSVRNYANKRM